MEAHLAALDDFVGTPYLVLQILGNEYLLPRHNGLLNVSACPAQFTSPLCSRSTDEQQTSCMQSNVRRLRLRVTYSNSTVMHSYHYVRYRAKVKLWAFCSRRKASTSCPAVIQDIFPFPVALDPTAESMPSATKVMSSAIWACLKLAFLSSKKRGDFLVAPQKPSVKLIRRGTKQQSRCL